MVQAIAGWGSFEPSVAEVFSVSARPALVAGPINQNPNKPAWTNRLKFICFFKNYGKGFFATSFYPIAITRA